MTIVTCYWSLVVTLVAWSSYNSQAACTCDTTVNFGGGAAYSQESLTDFCSGGVCNANPVYGDHNNHEEAVDYCAKKCVNHMAPAPLQCGGFFYQRHTNGHEICGFFDRNAMWSKAVWHGHSSGSRLCRCGNLRTTLPAATTSIAPTTTTTTIGATSTMIALTSTVIVPTTTSATSTTTPDIYCVAGLPFYSFEALGPAPVGVRRDPPWPWRPNFPLMGHGTSRCGGRSICPWVDSATTTIDFGQESCEEYAISRVNGAQMRAFTFRPRRQLGPSSVQHAECMWWTGGNFQGSALNRNWWSGTDWVPGSYGHGYTTCFVLSTGVLV